MCSCSQAWTDCDDTDWYWDVLTCSLWTLMFCNELSKCDVDISLTLDTWLDTSEISIKHRSRREKSDGCHQETNHPLQWSELWHQWPEWSQHWHWECGQQWDSDSGGHRSWSSLQCRSVSSAGEEEPGHAHSQTEAGAQDQAEVAWYQGPFLGQLLSPTYGPCCLI